MKSKTLSLKTIINKFDFQRKISYNSMKQLNKTDLLLLANKLIKNIPCNPKEHYQSFIIKEKQKTSKTSY